MSEIQVVVHKAEKVSEDCPICFSTIEEEMKIQGCQHSFCKDCLQEYFKTEINSLNVLKIKCPEQACPCILNSNQLEKLLATSDFERYQKLLIQKISKRTQNVICPKPGCSKIIHPAKDSSSTKCNCGVIICNLCGSLDHPDKSCIAALDPEFEAYAAANNLKMCLMCKTMISRANGCLHITCSVCDYDWCWICGREYTNLHEKKCPRTWSPLPPKYISKEDVNVSAGKKIAMFLLDILNLIILAFMIQIAFPFVLLNVLVEVRMPTRTRQYKMTLLSSAIFIQLLYTFFVVLIIYLMISFPPSLYALVVCLVITLLVPWGAKLLHLYLTRNQNTQRWRTRNSEAFHYTPANKPTVDVENRQQQQPIQAQPQPQSEAEPELKGDVEGDPLNLRVLSQETNAPPETESSPLTHLIL